MKEIIKKVEDGKLLLEISTQIYEKEAITATSYKFTDKAYIHIDPINESVIGVYFQQKGGESDESLDNIACRFGNELIDQQVRIYAEKKYSKIRDAIVEQAFSPINK